MKRYIRAATAALVMASGLGAVGCAHAGNKYRDAVDTCWPDRYNYAARQSVLAPFQQQVTNGHFLHQTIWNWYFVPGTDKLTMGGMEKLDSLARTTPGPDPKIYIQTARDLIVTPENTDKIVAARTDLDARRAAAIQRYLGTEPGAAVGYEIAVHDAAVPGINATMSGNSFRSQTRGYVGGLSGGGSSNVTATGGGAVVVNNAAAPAASGGGGGTGGGTGGSPGGGN